MDESERQQREEQAGQSPRCGHLELRGGVQPALVLAQLLPVLRFPDDFVDGLQDPSAAGLSALQQGQVWCAGCGTNKLTLTYLCRFFLFVSCVFQVISSFLTFCVFDDFVQQQGVLGDPVHL